MDMRVKDVMAEMHEGSDRGLTPFPAVVKALITAGVERYRCDLVRAERTYYMPDGENETFASASHGAAPATVFSAQGVESALKAVQAGRIDYRAFCTAILEAGCVEYSVSIAGRRAVYLGRGGEVFVEPFAGTK